MLQPQEPCASEILISIDTWALESCISLSYTAYDNAYSLTNRLNGAIPYVYSETALAVSGRFWHYVDGIPTAW